MFNAPAIVFLVEESLGYKLTVKLFNELAENIKYCWSQTEIAPKKVKFSNPTISAPISNKSYMENVKISPPSRDNAAKL